MLNYPAAYQSTKGSALDPDKAFYGRIASEHDTRTLVESIVVPIRSGQAWTVPAGHVFRIVTIEGPQVADLNMWNLHDPRERKCRKRVRQRAAERRQRKEEKPRKVDAPIADQIAQRRQRQKRNGDRELVAVDDPDRKRGIGV